MQPILRSALLLSLLLFGCVPVSVLQPPSPLLLVVEGDTIVDFVGQLDSADVFALSGQNGRAEGLIGSPQLNQADRDVLRVIATPGTLLRLVFSKDSADSALQPFLVVADASGKVLGLHDGASQLSAEVQVVVPSQSSLFVVLQDSQNVNDQALVGGGAFGYTLTLSEEPLTPEAVGPINTNTTSINSALSPGAGLALFSFDAVAGKKYSILVDPSLVADPSFIPFLVIYSPASFEMGAVITTDTPLQTIRGEFLFFGTGPTEVLFSVSDFFGAFGDNYSFTVSLREEL